jgi:hypothetical protein
MAIFIVRTNIIGGEGTQRFFYLETAHETIGAFNRELRGGPVECVKLRAHHDQARGKMVVNERAPFVIGPQAVVTVEMATLPFVDAVGIAA